jgi:hypothetical protein
MCAAEKSAVVNELLHNSEAEAKMKELSMQFSNACLTHYSEHA